MTDAPVKKPEKSDGMVHSAIVVAPPMVVLENPEPIKARTRAKRGSRLTGAKLRALAAKHKPPQSWYEEDLDGI